MTVRHADAVVIGAGVIGSGVAYELSRRGLATVSVERLPGAGQGSTSASSAVVRFNYSTRAGVAMSVEGLQYWLRWREHVGAPDETPVPTFVQCGMLLPKVPGSNHRRAIEHFDTLVPGAVNSLVCWCCGLWCWWQVGGDRRRSWFKSAAGVR